MPFCIHCLAGLTSQSICMSYQERIAELEDEALGDKPWHLIGEVSAAKRPVNSALEIDMDYDTTNKPLPAPTEEATHSLEDMIKRRIAEARWGHKAWPRPLCTVGCWCIDGASAACHHCCCSSVLTRQSSEAVVRTIRYLMLCTQDSSASNRDLWEQPAVGLACLLPHGITHWRPPAVMHWCHCGKPLS
eukprot:GHUV01044119.1.p1 GENE.GHUV01044119.1~~GHUV01044119.1.p1  ORF type:complete len:189 (-),score=35.71 GHUV01044119.1:228-794(-)